MLEGLAAWVLNTYVGEYVENLNTAQLSIALLQGAVELDNLPLKKDALKSLDIPIEVKTGFIGKITLQIPLRRLRSEPWVISIEKLYLVAGPLSNLQYDEEKEKQTEEEHKQKMLDALEAKWKIFQGTQPDASSTSSWFSYGASMATNVLENIQLKVKDVHLRYEDDKMNPACPFACGIVIKNLSVQSTDSSWTPKFVSHQETDKMFKLVDLKGFGVYCDANVTMMGDLSHSDLSDAFARDMYLSKSNQFQDHEYILHPITAQGKVTRNTSALPLRSTSSPRISLELTLSDMSVMLATDQYQSLNLWQREFARHGRRRKFRKGRPSCSISSSPRAWWKFAQDSFLNSIHERNRRLTKKFLTRRAVTVVCYARIYSEYLKGITLTSVQKTSKQDIEKELSFQELKVIREGVFMKLKRENQLASLLVETRRSPKPVEPASQPPAASLPSKARQSPPPPAPKPDPASSTLFQRWFPGWSGWTTQAAASSEPTSESASDDNTATNTPTSSSLPSLTSSTADLPSNNVLLLPSEEDLVTEEEIEQEIQDVINDSSENSSFLRKDSVFARMAFLLKKGSFKLKESFLTDKGLYQHTPLVELHCSTIGMEFESRPRSSAMKFSLAVGSLYMQDQTAKNSIFNYVICPQTKDPQSRTAFNPVSHLTSVRNTPSQLIAREVEGMEFFKLMYEKRPAGLFKYSLSINTQPLDIIYTPELIHRIKDMFSTPQTAVTRSADTVTSWQFERLKKQTQEDLKNTLDQLLEGKTSRWNINLDICAPKFIIPENTLDSNPQLVVLDLGNFHFKTIQSAERSNMRKEKDDDLEDKFETPLSTPPNESAEEEEMRSDDLKKRRGSDPILGSSPDDVVQDMLYEKYHIGLTEMQVLLGRLQDNWRHAYSKGTSLMHIVDRFSISVQLDRRLILTSDSQWPTAKLSGNLPSLTFHLNERKIQGMQKCLNKFLEPTTNRFSQTAGLQPQGSFESFANLTHDQADSELSSPELDSPRNFNEDNKLVALQFLINKLSLEVQSQDQALIELQVTGVQADVQTKPLNTSVILTVHSLLLVDAFQTYGRDFDLLVASHKNVILDSRSGSIRGSEVNSPTSPMSPMSPASPGSPTPDLTPSISFTSFQSIQDAISKAFHSVMPQGQMAAQPQNLGDSMDSGSSMSHQRRQSRALIQLEYEVITTPSTGGGDTNTRVLNLNFNSLDFIANQETLVEILGFIKRTFPSKLNTGSSTRAAHSSSLDPAKPSKPSKDLIHVNADFKRLNVMMVRFLASDNQKMARKVATATMSSAKFQAEFDESWEVEGSLGGLHLLDVTPDGTLYQQVVSIGQVQDGDIIQQTAASPNPEMFQTAFDDKVFSESYVNPSALARKNACTFVIRKQESRQSRWGLDGSVTSPHKLDLKHGSNEMATAEGQIKESEPFEALFDMASLSYIHCPKFLDELFDCMSEMQDYMTGVATSIRTAATEVAMGMVGVRAADKNATGSSGKLDSDPAVLTQGNRNVSLEDITGSVLLEEATSSSPNPKLGSAHELHHASSRSGHSAATFSIIFNARMESPILVIPRKPNSPQVLIAHLGEIVVDNCGMQENLQDSSCNQSLGQNQDLISLSLTKMNLYSLDLGQWIHPDVGQTFIANPIPAPSNDNSVRISLDTAGLLTSTKLSELTQNFGVPILHDTSVNLKIGKKALDIPYINPHSSSGLDGFESGLSCPPSGLRPNVDEFTTQDGLSFKTDCIVEQVSSVLDVHARISSPVKLSLSKEVYEQILQTVDHLTYDAEESLLQQHTSSQRQAPTSPLSSSPTSPTELHLNMPEFFKSVDAKTPPKSEGPENSNTAGNTIFSATSNQVEANFLAKHVDFEVPLFEVELRGNFGEGEQGLANLKLHDFAVLYEKNDRVTTHVSLRLKSLQMDDLLEPLDSKHRQIIVSKPSPKGKDIHLQRMFSQPKAMMSKSCPDSTIIAPTPRMPSSLPASFIDGIPSRQDLHQQPHLLRQQQQYQQHAYNTPTNRKRAESPGLYPSTPPPSPAARDLEPAQHRAVDDLVHIDVTLVDKKRPEFVSKYNMTNRFINIDFACLEATINLQTWVVLLDFLGMGAKVHDSGVTDPNSKIQAAESKSNNTNQDEVEYVNSKIKFQVESFTLVFNKPEYELAQATAANLCTTINLRDGNLSASGQLGSLSLFDQSPHGHLYHQRFVSTGRQVVEFHFFKYGLPDFTLLRAYDISLKLRMSSVRYIHTNRFQSELLAFAQHFLQLQDVLGRMRAASAGKKVNERATRGARILLDIEATSPILLIPHSSETHAVLVADLGNLRLKNKFIVDGETGTLRAQAESDGAKHARAPPKSRSSAEPSIFHRGMTESQLNSSFPPMRPIDPMAQSVYGSIDHDMRLEGFHSAGLDSTMAHGQRPNMHRHSSDSFLMSKVHQSSKPELCQNTVWEAEEWAADGLVKGNVPGEDEDYRCLLDVISVTLSDMDLFTARRVWKSDYSRGDLSSDMEFSTFVIEREHGPLLKEKCLLELHIEHNLEGDLSHTAPDFRISGKLSSVVCRLDGDQYQLIRGLLNHNLGEKLEEFQRPPLSHLQNPKIQTVLSGKPWKVISLTIDLRNVTVELLQAHSVELGSPEHSLARLDFIRSQLSFTSYSHQLREVDLVSNQIRIDDTRFKNEPVNSRPNVFSSILQPSPGGKEGSNIGLQMEMHLRSAPDSTQFTVLLNNMRLMCIFDWLMTMQEFISKELPDPFLKAEMPSSNPVSPRQMDDQLAQRKSPQNTSPLTVSRGIVTRRGPLLEEVKVPFELVLNFADTQFVVVENSTSLDTNAVILKNTAVILYKPQAQDKVLSCSLQSLELFSCCLMAEEDTALSIIDPTSVHVELNANPLPQPNPIASGLLGLRDAQRRQLVLEVSLKALNIRVSYHDMVMFLAIVNSLPQQALQAQQKQNQHQTSATSAFKKSDATTSSVRSNAAQSTGKDKRETTSLASVETAGVSDNLTKSMMGGLSIPCVNRSSNKEEEVSQLLHLGFPEDDVRRALSLSGWRVDEAALWLTENSKATNGKAGPEDLDNSFMLTALELNADSIMMCLIDDCGDADIPLAEIACNALSIKQEIEPCLEGKASFTLMAEYYNRKLSGWEPFLEPWKCFTEWKQYLKPEKKLAVQVAASDALNLNVTSTLIDLYKQTSGNWTQDYQSHQTDGSEKASSIAKPMSSFAESFELGLNESAPTTLSSSSSTPLSATGASQSLSKRSPFIPYVIRNDTGSNLWFLTATTTPSNLSGEAHNSQAVEHAYIQASDWKRVSPGERRPFHFHRREKIRHQKSHAMHVNQLVVTVEGWQRLSPVSVDKVGVYFRHADPQAKAPPHVTPMRVVFEVLQEGSARKLIVVRSALVVHNRLDSPIELKLEATDETGHYQCMTVPVNAALPIPLSCINMRMRARPCDWPVHFCSKPLDWQHVKRSGDKPDGIRTCQVIGPDDGIYRFFVCVSRQKFPEEGNGGAGVGGGSSVTSSSSAHLSHGTFLPTLPGHILTLLPPVTICNLLPLELHYYLRGMSTSGNLKAGREASLHGVDVSSKFDLGINLENFPACKELTIPPNTHNRKVLLRIYDNDKRMLKLVVRINMVKGGAMKLTISAQFWLVNKSGLPLVFKQNGCKMPAAGQFEEHEQARSVTPLLFSFSEPEELNLCQMRIGHSVHGQHSLPNWCSPFSLEGGMSKRALHVIQQQGNRPDWVYNIGIQVTPGRGRYRGTNIVTFAPRFVVDNQSAYKLAIAQHFVTKKEITQQEYLRALPQCSLPFHWPRVDLDQLLAVKILDIHHCRWSGGFYIDRINSFHINMRDPCGTCHLLKVEVVQQGPTFFIVFADADVMPPPFRIDNCTDVPVLYYQDQTGDDRLKTFIEPQKSIPYSWDEPTVKPLRLTLGIMGGTSASYSLDKLEEGEQLHYENFIYLAATATFDRSWHGPTPELVLDCVHNNNILFKRKEKSKRNQLWRMTGSGMLEHEGSMPPRDPRNPSATSEPGLVLDIADLAPRPGQCVPLTLRKPDVRRRSTQTWRFTEQGQLCCHAGMMCVQAVGGDRGLQEGAIAVLGPGPSPDLQDPERPIIDQERLITPAASPMTSSDTWTSGLSSAGLTGTLTTSSSTLSSSSNTLTNSGTPQHMLISRQKLRPGSGCISVRVSMDGPIRVIELVDIQHR
ncbi:vacuolar protein sorting-associated protein 13d, partial [Plakobranchus ocellatus]